MSLRRATQKQIDKWVKALESGKFKQGRYALGVNDRYCCLGVFCVINKIPFKKMKFEPDNSSDCNDVNGEVYDTLKKKLGNGCEILASMNDKGLSFQGIAEVIKKVGIPQTDGGTQ